MKEPVNKEAWRIFSRRAETLDVERVEKLLSLAEKTQTLWLSAFIDLDEDAAKLLIKHRGPSVFDGLRECSDGVAQFFGRRITRNPSRPDQRTPVLLVPATVTEEVVRGSSVMGAPSSMATGKSEPTRLGKMGDCLKVR